MKRIRELKAAIAADFRRCFAKDGHLVDLALNEAEAMAWQTGFPQLFFPTLALEKAQAVANWRAHQESIFEQRAVLAAA